MTDAGIMLDHSTAPAWGDTVQERYAKMKRVAEHFMLMQVGLCVFHEEDLSPGALPLKRPACDDADDAMPDEPRSPSKRLVARPFNFYVFPSATNKVEVSAQRCACSAVRDSVSRATQGNRRRFADGALTRGRTMLAERLAFVPRAIFDMRPHFLFRRFV